MTEAMEVELEEQEPAISPPTPVPDSWPMTLPTATLQALLAAVAPAISSRSTLPILQHVLLETFVDGRLVATTTNLDTSLVATVPMTCAEEGVFATSVSHVKLQALARLWEQEEITLQLKDQMLHLMHGDKSVYQLLTLPADEFPSIPTGMATVLELSVDASHFLARISEALPCAAKEESNPILCGVLFDSPVLVATDTHRLIVVPTGLHSDKRQQFIIPHQALVALRQSISRRAGVLSLRFSENHVEGHFVADGDPALAVSWVSRLIDGKYPNYEKILPKVENADIECDIDCAELRLRLSLLKEFARENADKIVLTFMPDSLTIAAESQEVGKGVERGTVTAEVKFKNSKHEAVDIFETAINVNYLLDFVKAAAARGSTFKLYLYEPATQCRPFLMTADDLVYVCMPMQI